jgi:hypothetical protein
VPSSLVWLPDSANRLGKTEQSLRTPVCLSGFGHVEASMNGIIYLIGLIVVVMAILSFLGLH